MECIYNNNNNNNICVASVCHWPLALTYALNRDSLVNRIKVQDVRRPLVGCCDEVWHLAMK